MRLNCYAKWVLHSVFYILPTLFATMARICERCGRGYNKANSRSHSNISTIKRQHINLQSKVVDGKRLRICTRCIKTLAKVAA